jgi:hypothetical protein
VPTGRRRGRRTTKRQKEISLAEARELAAQMGLPVPPRHVTSDGRFVSPQILTSPQTRWPPPPSASLPADPTASSASAGLEGGPASKGGTYEGEHNAVGQREGHGTYRWPNGDVHEGEWKAGKKDGRGTYQTADGGRVEVGTYRADKPVGLGLRWSADRQRVARLLDGKPQDEISLVEARALSAQIGLPMPPLLSTKAREQCSLQCTV